MPRVHCVTRSLEKLTMMRGENCMDASVSVISKMANTMETTVMMEAAMPPRMTWATWGSACEGKSTFGTQALRAGKVSSVSESSAPTKPSTRAMLSGRTRNPPRRLYSAWRRMSDSRLFTAFSVHLDPGWRSIDIDQDCQVGLPSIYPGMRDCRTGACSAWTQAPACDED